MDIGFWMIGWLTFKWVLAVSVGVLLAGIAELAIYMLCWYLFHLIFEPATGG